MKPNKVETEFISSELREEMVCRLCVHYCKAIDIEKNPEDLMFLDTLFEIEQQIFKECKSLEQYNSKFTELHNKKESFLASYLQNNNEKAEVVANFFEFSQPKNLTCRHNNEAENSTNDDIEQTEQTDANGNISLQSRDSLNYSFITATQKEKEYLIDQTQILDSIIASLPASTKYHDGPTTLQHLFHALINHLKAQPEAKLFLVPIETSNIKLIPKYLMTVSRVIDFTTINNKLEKEEYDSMWSLIEDVKGMTDSICRYFRKNFTIFKCAKKLAEIFDAQTARVMDKLGYCCNENHHYVPKLITCGATAKCVVKLGADYFRYNEFIVCLRCFEKEITEIKFYSQTVNKCNFKRLHNPLEPILEPMVECLRCHRKMHQICVQYLVEVQGEFYCDCCRQHLCIRKIQLRASTLPKTKFSSDIEEHLDAFLKFTDLAGKIVVRVLSDKLKIFAKLTEFAALTGPEKFSYRHRNLFVFYEIDGDDYCIFCINMHLYGSECAEPNRNCAYLSYLDSVCLIEDSKIRTLFYKNLVLSVSNTLQLRGYHWLYLWSCPPKQGDDYIFNIKPLNMRMPSRTKLIEWYKSLLELGVGSQFKHYYNVGGFAKAKNWCKNLNKIPYFKGDIWPTKIEELIKELKTEYKQKRIKGLKVLLQNTINRKSKSKLVPTKNLQIYRDFNFKAEMEYRMEKLFKLYNDDYFIVQLNEPTNERIEDTDLLLNHDLMDEPYKFMNHFADMKLEFSNKRRVKFSTLYMLQQSLQYQKKCFLCGTDIYGQLRNAPNNFCIKCLVDRKTINEIDTVSKTSKCTRMLKVTSIETPINLNIKDETRDSLEAKDDYDNDCWEDYEVNYSSTVFDEVIITFRDIISFKVVADIQQMKLKPTGKTVKRKRNTIGIVNPWKKTKATKAKNYCTMREMIRTIRSKTTPQVTGRKPKKVNSRNSPQYISIKDELVRYSQEFQASKIQATSSNIILKQEFGFEKPPAVYEVVDLSFSSQNSSVFHFGDLERTLSEVFVQGAVKETPALDNCLEDRVNSPQLIQSNSLHEVCEKVDLSLSSENSSIFSFNSMQRSLSKVIEETMFEKIDDLDDPMEENANSQKLIQTNSIHKLSNISQTNNNFQTLMQESIEFSESEQNVQEPIVDSDKEPNSFVDENNNLKEESVKAVVKGDKNSKIVRMCCMRYCNCRICQL